MIKAKHLRKRAEERLDSIHMFDSEGNFNSHNWNAGDGVIRQYTSYLEWECDGKREEKEFSIQTGMKGYEGRLLATYSYMEDYNYVQIVTDYYKWNADDMNYWVCYQYLIKWYKNRGKTEAIMMNGKPITLKQYVSLLRIIEATGFKFKMEE